MGPVADRNFVELTRLVSSGVAGLAVSNTPGVLTDATADLALTLMLWCRVGLVRGSVNCELANGVVGGQPISWGVLCQAKRLELLAWVELVRPWRTVLHSALV